ncbi:MAG: methyltransferase domain-containing protein [Longimicrobiales bacterium]
MYRHLSWAASAYRERSHERRADLFVRLMRPRAGDRMLDLGGGDGSFAARIARRVSVRVTVADVADTRFEARDRYGFSEVALKIAASGSASLPFDDGEFDLVLCNSVIEHVTLPRPECRVPGIRERDWRERAAAAQRSFADEIRRVGGGYFVQTPHRSFPIDVHTWLPLTNFLPHDAARRLVLVLDGIWVKKCGVADWRLLATVEMRRLFPDAAIHIERLAYLPKSIIAYRRRRA